MYRLLVDFTSDRTCCGVLSLLDDEGHRLCGPFPVAGRSSSVLAAAKRNVPRNPSYPYGDVPLGGYAVRRILKTGSRTGLPRAQFGPHGVVVLEPVSGDAAVAEANGRFHFIISGGNLSIDGQLRSTAGGLRLKDEHQLELLRCLRRMDEARCDIGLRETLPLVEHVADDPELNISDPLPLTSAMTTARLGLGRDMDKRQATRAMVFGLTVSFVLMPEAAPARTSDQSTVPDIAQHSPLLNDLKGPRLQYAPPQSPMVRLAYETSEPGDTSFVNSEMSSSVEGTAHPIASEYASKLLDIWTEAKPVTEVGSTTVDVLKDITGKMGEAAEADNFQSAMNFVGDADTEFRISNYSIASQALEGVSAALALKSSYEIGAKVGEAINDLNDGKISVEQFVEKVGPAPAKLLLTRVGVPFADQYVDSGIATINAGVSWAIDAGFDFYDKYKGYK